MSGLVTEFCLGFLVSSATSIFWRLPWETNHISLRSYESLNGNPSLNLKTTSYSFGYLGHIELVANSSRDTPCIFKVRYPYIYYLNTFIAFCTWLCEHLRKLFIYVKKVHPYTLGVHYFRWFSNMNHIFFKRPCSVCLNQRHISHLDHVRSYLVYNPEEFELEKHSAQMVHSIHTLNPQIIRSNISF